MAGNYTSAAYTSQMSPAYETTPFETPGGGGGAERGGSAADYYNSSHHLHPHAHTHTHTHTQQQYLTPQDVASTGNGAPSAAGGVSGSRGINLRPRLKPRRALGSGLVPSFSSGLFLAVVLVEALVVLGLVISVFAIVQLRTEVLTQDAKTVPVFLALFVFGSVFLVLIALDAFRLHNTIQIIGAVVFNLALMITAALQVSQVRAAFDNQDRYGRGVPCHDRPRRRCGAVATLYPAVKPQLVATPIIIAVAEVLLVYLTFKLWQDFGFQIYRKIGADLVKRKMMLIYQVFVVFLKFDFFFGTAFCLAYLILVSQHQDAEFGLTIAALPAAIVVLILSAVAVRKEVYTLMIFCILCMIAGIVYFVFKITRIFEPSTEDEYRTVRLSMTFFSVFSIVSLLMTVVLAIWCTFNFGRGLKDAHESLGTLFDISKLRTKKNQQQDGWGTVDGGKSDTVGGRIELTDSIPDDGSRPQPPISPSEEYGSSSVHHGFEMVTKQQQQQQQYRHHQQPYASYPAGQSTSPTPTTMGGRPAQPSIYSNNSVQPYYQQQSSQSQAQTQQQHQPQSPTNRPGGLSRRISLD